MAITLRSCLGWKTGMSDWQSIKTAPKDGRMFLVWCPATGLSVMTQIGNVTESWSLTGSAKHPEPTHWQPLPSPPKGDQ